MLFIGPYQAAAVTAACPISTSPGDGELTVRRGFVVQKDGTIWRDLLRFEDNTRNPQGFIGIDFIDSDFSFEFTVKLADERSDSTPGFTIYLTYCEFSAGLRSRLNGLLFGRAGPAAFGCEPLVD
jgi:hypothetical protein